MKYKVMECCKDMYRTGVYAEGKRIYAKVEADTEHLALLLYQRNEQEAFLSLAFDPGQRVGNVWFLAAELSAVLPADTEYRFFAEERGCFADPYGKSFSGRDTWGKKQTAPLRAKLYRAPYDWEGDSCLRADIHKAMIYRVNVRALTKSPSSGVVHKGTFQGLTEKLPYIRGLGFTTLLLMPCQEFAELRKDGKVDLWGYEPCFHFAPKASFCTRKNRQVQNAYKDLVKACHRAGMELWQEFYFSEEDSTYALDVLRYYVSEYHIDGVYITGSFRMKSIVRDAGLAATKLVFPYTEEGVQRQNMLLYNDGFQNDMRRFLKGDEGMLFAALQAIRSNPPVKQIKYMADMQGFSLMDVFCYDRKHNEDNGENNKDGALLNHSWNCGEEGKSKKKKILQLREQLYRNALAFTFLSPSVPLLCAGDEFGHSRGGNNNAYCQDNALSYPDWKLANKHKDRTEWLRYLTALRERYAAFSRGEEFTMLDTLSCGMPDLSVHGTQAWKAEFEQHHRQMGLYYSAKYFPKEKEQHDIYILYNMHWEAHDFALPRIAKTHAWYLAFDTGIKEGAFYAPLGEEKIFEKENILLAPRSMVCLFVKQKNSK